MINTPFNLSQKKPLLLVVDDQPGNIQILYGIFKDECEVCMATNGADAIEFCRNRQPDLVLLDVVMPEIGGYEVCERLKADPLTEHIPLIFVTAQNEPAEEAYGFEKGGVDFITKPFHANVVKARVRTHLTLKYQSDLLRTLSLTDGLTGIPNRRQFDQVIQNEWQHCMRAKQSIAVIMIDVDFFKFYNDHYGHQAGDQCLVAVAAALKSKVTRSNDLLARYGGEEFAVILPSTPLSGAEQKARQLEQVVRDLKLPHEKSTSASVVTISLGVAVTVPVKGQGYASLIAQADGQLYVAKQSGRGKMRSIQVCSGDSSTEQFKP
jgi:diguanylate cyclase (GGDEF)-like protein